MMLKTRLFNVIVIILKLLQLVLTFEDVNMVYKINIYPNNTTFLLSQLILLDKPMHCLL